MYILRRLQKLVNSEVMTSYRSHLVCQEHGRRQESMTIRTVAICDLRIAYYENY